MHKIDGKSLSEQILQDQATLIASMAHKPRLAVLLVGDNPASIMYVGRKHEAAERIGAEVVVEQRPAESDEESLVDVIQAWNTDPSIHGILIQLPLPSNMNTQRLIDAITLEKDVDGFKSGSPVISPTHEAVLRLLAATPVKLAGAQSVILANSNTFADPLAALMRAGGMSVEIWHPDDIGPTMRDRLKSEIDVLVTAVGRPDFIHASMLKNDAVIIDVGTTKVGTKTKGDAELESFESSDVWITPVPGGVGPMTVALLMRNLVTLATK